MKPHHHKYKNIILFILGLAFALLLSKNPLFTNFLLKTGNLGYLGAFIGGVFFTSTFTLPIGAVVILDLAKDLNPILLILISGIGAVTGDYLIFKFIKDDIDNELIPIFKEVEVIVGKSHFKKILHTKYFAWTLPVLGSFIIASPLPDELGVSLMGLSKIALSQFMLISWLSHSIGISLIVGANHIF